LAALDIPISIARAEVLVTASIGVASTTDDVSSQTLIERADAAMYRGKEGGRNCIVVFDEDMRHETRDRLAIRASLHRAVERREMRVHYQPMVSVAGGHTVGVEALARWRQPDGQLVGPAIFIEAAEESGLIIPLGALVLEEACRQLARWRATGRGPLSVSVNLSARQVADIGLVGEVARVLVETGIDPSSLILEITESVLMEAAASTTTLQRLKGLGVGLAIDDFGTGYSSLSYLKRFPVDSLKVDRSFIEGLGRDAEDTAIVAAVINLAHTLGLGAVAEGVETGEQLSTLKDLGCEVAQGYHLGRPVPAELVLLDR
jgi:EAL domain-containing protein (putative c-di-GMP-specific phosphodiesterase class I)